MAKKDLWLERAAAQDERDLPDLFSALTGESRPATERRLAALCAWPRSPAIARGAGELLRAFPFDVWALGGATWALGLALVHHAGSRAFRHTELARHSNEVERWRGPALEAARGFTAARERPPSPGASAGTVPPLPDKPKALHAAWMKLATLRAPDTLPLLLESLGDGAGTDIAARAIALLDFARDARIADALAEVLAFPPVTVYVHNPLFVALGLGVVAHGDKRHAPALRKLADTVPQLEWLTQLLDVRRAVTPAASKPAAPKGGGPRDERSFLSWIAEAPDDLARRSVFGDWLAERGDPRGELLALQLAARGAEPSPAAQKRIAALLKKHEKAWLRTFSRCLFALSEPVFADGMLSEIGLALRKFVPKPDDGLLVGLRKLRVFGREDSAARKLMASPLLSGLRELDAPVSLVAALGPAARARLVSLAVRIDRREDLAILGALELPALRRLSLDKGTVEGFGLDVRPEQVAALPFVAGLDELEIAPSIDPGLWLAALRGSRLRRLDVNAPTDVRYRFTLGPAPTLRVVVESELRDHNGAYLLARPLATVARDVLARARIELRAPRLLDGATARAVEALGVPSQIVQSEDAGVRGDGETS